MVSVFNNSHRGPARRDRTVSAHCRLTSRTPGFGNAVSRRMTVARYAVRRAALKAVIRSPPSRRARDRDAPRVRNRDGTDGRPRGCLRAFGLPRVRLRERAHAGHLPGARKTSR